MQTDGFYVGELLAPHFATVFCAVLAIAVPLWRLPDRLRVWTMAAWDPPQTPNLRSHYPASPRISGVSDCART